MDKIYVGNGKEKKFDNSSSIISVTLDLSQLIREYNNHGYLNGQGKETIRIDVGTRRSVGEYGDTHSVTLNTWHPNTFNTPQPITIMQGEKSKPETFEDDGESDLPF